MALLKIRLLHALENNFGWASVSTCGSRARAGHVTSRGGKCGLSNKPNFPPPLCLSQQHKYGEEPEAHASGACLLLCFWLCVAGQWCVFSHVESKVSHVSVLPDAWVGCDIHKWYLWERRKHVCQPKSIELLQSLLCPYQSHYVNNCASTVQAHLSTIGLLASIALPEASPYMHTKQVAAKLQSEVDC